MAYSGVKIPTQTYAERVEYTETVYMGTDGEWHLVAIDDPLKVAGMVGICPEASGVDAAGSGAVLTFGFVANDDWEWAENKPVYFTAAGLLTQTKPESGTVRVAGYPILPTVLFFNPSDHVDAPSGGTGDVTGPGSSTDNAIARFHGDGGKTIQNSVVTVSDGGTINIPIGQTYNMDGAPHTHSAYQITATKNAANGYCGLDASADVAMAQIPETMKDCAIVVTIDGGGAEIADGVAGEVEIPFAGTVAGWTIVADQEGSIVVDVNKTTYAGYPGSLASIAGTEKPTLSSAQKNRDLTLSTWTTAIAKGDVLQFEVDSCTTCERVEITLRVTRT